MDDFKNELNDILSEILSEGKIEIYGTLEIKVENIKQIALLKGNTIYVNPIARNFPKYVLKYIIAHELAHIAVKKHTKKFWHIVKIIYPEYEKANRWLLENYAEYIR